MYKRILSIGMVLVLLVCMFAVPAMASAEDTDSVKNEPVTETGLSAMPETGWFAELFQEVSGETQPAQGLVVTLVTDKEEYKASAPVDITVNLHNLSDSNIEKLSIEYQLPDGYVLEEKAKKAATIDVLPMGREQSVTVTCKPVASGAGGINVLFVVLCVVAVMGMAGVILLLCKKKKILSVIPALISLGAIIGCIIIFFPKSEATDKQKVSEFTRNILIDGKETAIGVSLSYDSVLPDPNEILVKYNLLLADAYIKNSNEFIGEYLEKGDTLKKPKTPKANVGTFAGWYTDYSYSEEFDFSKPLEQSVTLYAKWEIDTTDSDGDGLIDIYETGLESNPQEKDTDKDGLEDGFEWDTGLDPCKADTDGNGISDYEDDLDGDGLSNGYEAENGLDASSADTDMDGLSDYEEVMTVKTNPLETDTDGDGGNDFWEYSNGYDPLEYNRSFTVKKAPEPVTEYSYVSAGVELELDGKAVESLSVNEVGVMENSMVRYTLPGYLGAAYDFSVNGAFDSATLTFQYNTDVYGEPSEEFQPRIYYINEETGLYEELDNQVVENGMVKAVTSHFSTYILLNKVEYDKIWEEVIAPPEGMKEEGCGLAMVLLLDCSPSMSENDPEDVRVELINKFLDKMGKNDRASVIPFSAKPYTYSELTNDFEALKKEAASAKISYGSNLLDAMDCAINMLVKDKISQYKYIVVLSDGEVDYRNNYEEWVKNQGIVIHTIGLGNYKTNPKLEKIAQNTGGTFYPVFTADEFAVTVEETSAKVIDYVTDSNYDGISDYYTKLIFEGKMPLAEDYRYFDFGNSPDWDGDGLKNGEEIEVVESDKGIYLRIKSNPLLQHSDLDGIRDDEEVRMGSNPMAYSVKKYELDTLFSDVNFYHVITFNNLDQNTKYKLALELNSFIYGVRNKKEIYRKTLIDYFLKYPPQQYFQDKLGETQTKESFDLLKSMYAFLIKSGENLEEGVGDLGDGVDYSEYLSKVIKLMDSLGNSKADNEWLDKMSEEFGELGWIYAKMSQMKDNKYSNNLMRKFEKYAKEIRVTKAAYEGVKDLVGKTADMLEVYNLYTSYSLIESNDEVFERSIDLLYELWWYADAPELRGAAFDIIAIMNDQKEVVYGGIFEKIVSIGVSKSVEKVLEKVPYVQIVFLVRDGFDMLTGISEDIEQSFEMLAYAELGNATRSILMKTMDDKGNYYELKDVYRNTKFDVQTYVVHMATARVYGERKYAEVLDSSGIFSFTGDSKEEAVAQILKNYEAIFNMASGLNVPLYGVGE